MVSRLPLQQKTTGGGATMCSFQLLSIQTPSLRKHIPTACNVEKHPIDLEILCIKPIQSRKSGLRSALQIVQQVNNMPLLFTLLLRTLMVELHTLHTYIRIWMSFGGWVCSASPPKGTFFSLTRLRVFSGYCRERPTSAGSTTDPERPFGIVTGPCIPIRDHRSCCW